MTCPDRIDDPVEEPPRYVLREIVPGVVVGERIESTRAVIEELGGGCFLWVPQEEE